MASRARRWWAPSPRGRRRPARTAARTSSRCARGCAIRTAPRCGPRDFRASMERYLRATGKAFPPYFSRIAGVPACMRRPARCDLSRGVESDRRRGTITIHLTAPDAELLDKLTMPFAYVVPAGTPARRSLNLAPPGTGPYRFAEWDSRRGGRLVRNPRFHPNANRPPGLVDQIAFKASMRGNGGAARHHGRRARHVGRGAPLPAARSHHRPARRQGARHQRAGAGAQRPDGGHHVDVPQRPASAVRRHPRPPRRQSRHRPRRARRARRRSRDREPGLHDRPGGVPGLRARLRLHGQPVTRRRVDRARPRARAPADRGVRNRGGARRRRRAGAHSGIASAATSCRSCASSVSARGCACFPSGRTSSASTRLVRAIRWASWDGPRTSCSPSSFIEGTSPAHPPHAQYDGNPSHLCDGGVTRAVARARATPARAPRRPGRSADRRLVDLAPAVPDDQWPHIDLRLEAGRQRHPPRAVDDAARPDVGALSLDSFQNWNL